MGQFSAERPLAVVSYDIITWTALSFVCENMAAGGRFVWEASVDGMSHWVARCPGYTAHT